MCGEGVEDLEHVMLKCGGLKGERDQVGWEELVQGEEAEQVRRRLGIGREDEGDRGWIGTAKRYLVGWRRKGAGG